MYYIIIQVFNVKYFKTGLKRAVKSLANGLFKLEKGREGGLLTINSDS